jgi:hypothetical protein
VAIYLYLNAALYGLFAVLCTLNTRGTSASLGYLTLSTGGRSEYLVIYGGLQLGLAVFFALLASRPPMHALGLTFALCLYAPIATYRVVTVALFRPVPALTLAVAALEVGLLVGGVVLWLRTRG